MATTSKKSAAAGKASKAAPKAATKAAPHAAPKAASKAAEKPAAKAPAKAEAKTETKARSKKAEAAPPPPPVYVSAFSVGHKVTHPTFGDGKVLAVDRDQLTIKFASAEKIILDSFVKAGSKG